MKAILIDPVDQTVELIDVKDYSHLCSFLSYIGPEDPGLKPVLTSLADDNPQLHVVSDYSQDACWGSRTYRIRSQVSLRTFNKKSGLDRVLANGKAIVLCFDSNFDKLVDVPFGIEHLKSVYGLTMYHVPGDVVEPYLPGIFGTVEKGA